MQLYRSPLSLLGVLHLSAGIYREIIGSTCLVCDSGCTRFAFSRSGWSRSFKCESGWNVSWISDFVEVSCGKNCETLTEQKIGRRYAYLQNAGKMIVQLPVVSLSCSVVLTLQSDEANCSLCLRKHLDADWLKPDTLEINCGYFDAVVLVLWFVYCCILIVFCELMS